MGAIAAVSSSQQQSAAVCSSQQQFYARRDLKSSAHQEEVRGVLSCTVHVARYVLAVNVIWQKLQM